jgi:hypothetical protein
MTPTEIEALGDERRMLHYCGKPITDMTRDELLEAVENMAFLLDKAETHHRQVLTSWRAFRRPRAGWR